MNDSESNWSPQRRGQEIERLKSGESQWDLLVVGGGITGAGIYREAARLGLKVLLVEQQDFAWGTSSRSSKMVHGGLRYLGSGQFGLANDSVKERQNLMNELPGLVNPLPFMMAHYKGVFPGPWIFDKLLAVYDFMAGQRYRHFFKKGIGDFLVPGINTQRLKGATQFSDAVTDDARLVLRVLHDGNNDGGTALNYLKAVDTLIETNDQNVKQVRGLRLKDQVSGDQFEVSANVVINATGAWTDELRQTLGQQKVIRPLRGSHLVVPFWRLPTAFTVSFFHADDKRPVFVFPWEGVTVIGTTDLDHQQDETSESSITSEEVSYLLAAANHQFHDAHLAPKDVRATWSGVRPVVSKHQEQSADTSRPNKPSDEKREHAVWDDHGLISVAGGKLTTYRLIALDVLQKAAPYLSIPDSQLTTNSHFEPQFVDARVTGLSTEAKKRLSGRYGESAGDIIVQAKTSQFELQKIATTDTLWAELIWACQSESVQHLDDLLLRRTRIGLLLDRGAAEIFDELKIICQQYLFWDDLTWQAERSRYQKIIDQHYSLPGANASQIEA
jgi:glycerol-3-phosphate dehydrogenase